MNSLESQLLNKSLKLIDSKIEKLHRQQDIIFEDKFLEFIRLVDEFETVLHDIEVFDPNANYFFYQSSIEEQLQELCELKVATIACLERDWDNLECQEEKSILCSLENKIEK